MINLVEKVKSSVKKWGALKNARKINKGNFALYGLKSAVINDKNPEGNTRYTAYILNTKKGTDFKRITPFQSLLSYNHFADLEVTLQEIGADKVFTKSGTVKAEFLGIFGKPTQMKEKKLITAKEYNHVSQ